MFRRDRSCRSLTTRGIVSCDETINNCALDAVTSSHNVDRVKSCCAERNHLADLPSQ
jgi:hypothetical protein